MATDGVAAPMAVRSRPAWIEGLVGQLLALLASLAIAVLAGSLLIVAYGENPLEVYSSILDASMGSADGIGYVLAIATPLIFAALAVAVCFKGGLFNIGVEGQYLVAMVTAAWAELSLGSARRSLWRRPDRRDAGGMIWPPVGILKVRRAPTGW
jgi:simple sugar transport system permease protein